jgi:hypothetical protein
MSGLIDFVCFALRPQKAIARILEQKHLISDQKQCLTEMQRYAKLNAKLSGESKMDEYDSAAADFSKFF